MEKSQEKTPLSVSRSKKQRGVNNFPKHRKIRKEILLSIEEYDILLYLSLKFGMSANEVIRTLLRAEYARSKED